VHTSKPTGSAECPPEVEHVHTVEHLINNQVASGVIRDEDLDEEVIEISSDDSHKVKVKKEPKKYVAQHIPQNAKNILVQAQQTYKGHCII
jgi:hypothetical protein